MWVPNASLPADRPWSDFFELVYDATAEPWEWLAPRPSVGGVDPDFVAYLRTLLELWFISGLGKPGWRPGAGTPPQRSPPRPHSHADVEAFVAAEFAAAVPLLSLTAAGRLMFPHVDAREAARKRIEVLIKPPSKQFEDKPLTLTPPGVVPAAQGAPVDHAQAALDALLPCYRCTRVLTSRRSSDVPLCSACRDDLADEVGRG
jgi:hypothetical protein